MKKAGIFLLIILISGSLFSQILPVDSVFNKKKFTYVVSAEVVASASTLTYLGYAWYAGYDHSPFHFFNDGLEWRGMDKIGHATTAYATGKIGYDLMRFSGVNKTKSLIYGGGVGFAYLSFVELFDGFSAEWGASSQDLLVDFAGSSFFIAQQAIWDEQRISMKFSFHPTDYAQYRPNLLGKNLGERMIKDYNGQTYWLSANVYSFLPKESKFPKWINVAFGYGADGMLGSFSNPTLVNGVLMPDFERYSQYYLSLDIDWTKIPVKNPYLKAFLEIFSFIKLPFPALEMSKKGVSFHPIYF